MNLNSRQTEQLKLLADLMETMRNPEGLAQLIKESNEAVAAHKKAVEDGRRITDIDAWYAGQVKHLNERDASLEAKELAYKKKTESDEAKYNEKTTKLNENMASVVLKMKTLDERLAEHEGLSKMEKELRAEKDKLLEWHENLLAKENFYCKLTLNI